MTFELTAKATLILIAVGVAGVMLRRSSAAARHLVRVLGLVAALALPLLVLALPAWDLPLLPAPGPAEVTARLDRPLAVQPGPGSLLGADPAGGEYASESTPWTGRGDKDAGASMGAGLGGEALRPSPTKRLAIALIPLLWLLGTAAFLTRLAVGWLRMTRLALDSAPLECPRTLRLVSACLTRLGISGEPRVLTSPSLRVPVLWGFLNPTLMLPAAAISWPAGRLRIVLLHELAHLRRLDGLALLVGRLTTAAWWFHPLAWMVERAARRDCERACDDVVLACGERPSTYAGHLLDIVRELPASTAVPATALAVVGPSPLEDRVRSILHPGLRRGLSRPRAIAVLGLVVVGLVSVSSASLVARPPDRAEQKAVTGDHEGEDAFGRAYDLHRAERFEQAIAAFEEAADAGFKVSTSMYNMACGYARLGRAREAVEWIQRALDEGFSSYDLLFGDSDLDPIRRDAAFRKLMEQVKDDHDPRWSTKRRDRYGLVVEKYEALLDENSTNGHAWYKVGSALLQLRDFDRSSDALERAAQHLAHGNQNALYNLACAHALQGGNNQALDYLEQAVLAGFESEERLRNDSDLDGIRGEERFEEIRKLHYTLSLDRFGHGKDGLSEYSSRRWAPAVEEFTAFVRQNPDVGRAWYNLGWALHFSRRHAEAREAFTRQLELDYRPVVATYNIGCTYAMDGQADEALEWLGRAVDTGFVSAGQMAHDDDLALLRGDPRFEDLLERASEMDEDTDWHRQVLEKLGLGKK